MVNPDEPLKCVRMLDQNQLLCCSHMRAVGGCSRAQIGVGKRKKGKLKNKNDTGVNY